MARPRKKPFFDPDREMEALIDQVATEYGVYNDLTYDGLPGFYGKPSHTPSLNEVSRKFGLNVLKVRKLLITAGVFSTKTSRMVQTLHDSGASVEKIMEETGLSRASVHSYLPYDKVAYRLNETSPNADRLKLYRERKKALEELSGEIQKRSHFGQGKHEGGEYREEAVKDKCQDIDRDTLNGQRDCLWNVIRLFEGYWFEAEQGGRYRYTVQDDGLHFSGRKDAIAKNTVNAIFEIAIHNAKGYGTSEDVDCLDYLYPVFQRFGVFAL